MRQADKNMQVLTSFNIQPSVHVILFLKLGLKLDTLRGGPQFSAFS